MCYRQNTSADIIDVASPNLFRFTKSPIKVSLSTCESKLCFERFRERNTIKMKIPKGGHTKAKAKTEGRPLNSGLAVFRLE